MTNLGVVLPDELLNKLNDYVGETVVGRQAFVRKVVVKGQAVVGAHESDKDTLLLATQTKMIAAMMMLMQK